MRWTVSFQVISGAFGSRLTDGRNQIWVGETVRFTLSPDPSLPNSYAMLQDAQRARNWAQLPQMTVTGTRSITVSANVREPLQIEYTFRYEGQKQLRFIGTPQQVVLPTATRSSRGASTTALFSALDYDLALRVVPITPRGQDAASMAGAAGRGYQRGGREREQEQAQYRGLERDQRQAEQLDRDRRRDTAEEERREALSGARGSRRGALRNGLLNFPLRTETELLRMSISQVEDYLRNLQAAVNVTPPLDLANYGWRSQGSELQYADTWETERLQDGRIKFYQVRRFRSTRPAATARGFEIRSVPESYRHNEIIFPGNAWIVAQVTGRGEKALFPVADLSSQLEAEQWARLLGSLVSLAFFVAEAAVAPEAAIFELLLEIVLPPEALLAVAGVSIVRGLVSGLRLVITRSFRGSARSAVRSLSSTVDDAVDQGRRTITSPSSPPPSATGGSRSLAERGTLDRGGSGRSLPPDTSSGGDGIPPRSESSRELRGSRRSRYRRSAQPVTGRIDSIIGSDIRSELVRDASPGELMAAEAFGRTGREVVILPETETGWSQLAFQTGWSRERRDRLQQQLAEAVRRDRLSSSRDPDLLIDGRVWDVLAPTTLRGGNTLDERALTSIVQGIWSKGQSRQTRRVAYVVDGYSEALPEIRRALRRHLGSTPSPFGGNIDEVVLVQQGILIEVYSRGRGISP